MASDGSDVSADEDGIADCDVIVMHPGAQFLRIGLSKNPFPFTILHAIARKVRSQPDKKKPKLAHDNDDSDSNSDDLEASSDANKADENQKKSAKTATSNSDTKVVLYNSTVVAEEIPKHMDDQEVTWDKIDDYEGRDYAVGNELLTLDPTDVKITYPCRFGLLDIPKNSTYEAVREDLVSIWTHAVEDVLNIPKSQFPEKRIMLLIPDSYRKRHVRVMTEVLLEEMGFRGIYLHQEGVCATFGAGLSHACVVDVGASKISVSCIEEGMSIPETRVSLRYGGDDVTRELKARLTKVKFPYKELDLNNTLDWRMMSSIKEGHCHLVPKESLNAEPIKLVVRQPTMPLAVKYSFRISHDAVKCPLILFNFKKIGTAKYNKHKQGTRFIVRDLQTRQVNDTDPTDAFDDAFISEVSTLQYPTRYNFNQLSKVVPSIAKPEATKKDQPKSASSDGLTTDGNKNDSSSDAKSTNGITIPPGAPQCAWKGCVSERESYGPALLDVWTHVMDTHIPVKAMGGHKCEWEGCEREAGKAFPNKASFMSHLRTHIPILGSQMTTGTARVATNVGGTAERSSTGTVGSGSSSGAHQCYAEIARSERANAEKKMQDSVEVEKAIGALKGIDDLIAFSIAKCGEAASGVGAGDEIMKKMYTSILLVGGGQMFRGYATLLEQRLYARVPPSFRKGAQKAVQVIESPKDMDARMMAWKGGSILARLEILDSFWIEKDEWLERGVGVLRDVLPFIW